MVDDYLLIAGDVFFDSEINIDNDIIDEFSSATFSIVNLEGCVNSENFIAEKCAPVLTFAEQWHESLETLNITHFNTFNNHAFDHGLQNYQYLKNKITQIGSSVLLQNEIFLVGGFRIGICTTLEFNEHYEASDINFCDSQSFINSIKKFRNNCDYLVVQCHAGLEKVSKPVDYFRKLYRYYVDLGADIVIGHHPHIIQEIEVYNNKKIYYSIGDFIFGSCLIDRFSKYGLLIKLKVKDGLLIDEPIVISQNHNNVSLAEINTDGSLLKLTEFDAVQDLIRLIQIANTKLSLNAKVLSLKIILRSVFTPRKMKKYSKLVRYHLETNHTYKHLITKYNLEMK